MSTWEHKLPDVEQRIALVFVARSPIARLIEAKKARGWTRHKVFSDASGDYTRDYVSRDDADVPGYSVFTRRDGTIRHFWSGEMSGMMADPGQDPRGAPDLDMLWNHTRHHARGARNRLVSEARIIECVKTEHPQQYAREFAGTFREFPLPNNGLRLIRI